MKNRMASNNPIIFLPGWGFDCQIWSAISQRFQEAKLLNYVDLPAITIEELTTQLAKDAPNNAIIIAWSFGGILAINLCHLYPEKCHKLVLVASTPKFVADINWHGVGTIIADTLINQANKKLGFMLKNFIKWISFPGVTNTQQEFVKNNLLTNPSLSAQLLCLFNADLREAYKNISQPILHILGSQDSIVNVANAENLLLLNSQSTFSIIKSAGHIPFITHETRFSNDLYEFLRK